MATKNTDVEKLVGKKYRHGFVTDIESDTVPPGLNEDVMGQFIDPEEPGIFPPSAEWDGETAHDRLWS